MALQRGWHLGVPWPHDGRNREWGSGKSRMELFGEYTHTYRSHSHRGRRHSAVRAILPTCAFDAGPCSEGLNDLGHKGGAPGVTSHAMTGHRMELMRSA